MADDFVKFYWLGNCSAVREITQIVIQSSRETSDMPHIEKRKTLLEGGIIFPRSVIAEILNKIRL